MIRQPEGDSPRQLLEDAIRCVIERLQEAGVDHDWEHSLIDAGRPSPDKAGW